jgi:hypothetical protein
MSSSVFVSHLAKTEREKNISCFVWFEKIHHLAQHKHKKKCIEIGMIIRKGVAR